MARWAESGSGVVSVVTGAGKTAFALLTCTRIWREDPTARLIVIVPSIALLDQWYVAIQTELAIPSQRIALFSGESRAKAPRSVNLAVINSARDLAPMLSGDGNNFLVVDECHRAGSPENARALAIAGRYTLGLSATPVREFDDGFERYVAPTLGPVIFEYDYVDAKRDGILSDFALHHFRMPLTASERRTVASGPTRARQGLVGPGSSRRNAAAIAIVERLPGTRLVFHERIANATAIADLLNRRGERVGLYHSQVSPSIRRRNLELFKEGQFTTLVTCRALDEGVNVPEAGVAVIAASTRSTRQRIQRLGRVLRPHPDKSLAIVATVYGSDEERATLEREANTLSDVAAVQWFEMDL